MAASVPTGPWNRDWSQQTCCEPGSKSEWGRDKPSSRGLLPEPEPLSDCQAPSGGLSGLLVPLSRGSPLLTSGSGLACDEMGS